MIDIHSHILPFVDDGSQSLSTSVTMLKTMIDSGVTDVIITPHYRDKNLNTANNLSIAFDEFNKHIKQLGLNVKLYLGQEIFFSERIKNLLLSKDLLTLNSSNYVLIELNYKSNNDALDIVYELSIRGYKVILAHIERYKYLTIDDIIELKENGALIQVNAEAVLGLNGHKTKRKIKKLFKNQLVDFVSSDYHEHRNYMLKQAREYIEKKFGKEVADRVTRANASKILEG